jgi:phosphoribosylamine--glycine ligase
MGSYSPHAALDETLRRRIVDAIIRPVLGGLAADGHPYRGVLYAGLMLTAQGPKVLEFNARFGDPETQVLLPRLAGDWLPLLHQCATGRLLTEHVEWDPRAAVCVVMAAEGYPQTPVRGRVISGIERAESLEDTLVFHAGTARDGEGRWSTAGGRVLGVTALDTNLERARSRAYAAVGSIQWDGEHHRSDIAESVVAPAGGSGWTKPR